MKITEKDYAYFLKQKGSAVQCFARGGKLHLLSFKKRNVMQLSCPTDEPDGVYVMLPGDELCKTGELTGDEFKLDERPEEGRFTLTSVKALLDLHRFVGKDELRPLMKHVRVESDGQAVATDSFAMGFGRLHQGPEGVEANLPVDRTLISTLKDPATVSVTDKYVVYSDEDREIILSKESGRYPAWRIILFEMDMPACVKFDMRWLKNEVLPFAKLIPEGGPLVHIVDGGLYIDYVEAVKAVTLNKGLTMWVEEPSKEKCVGVLMPTMVGAEPRGPREGESLEDYEKDKEVLYAKRLKEAAPYYSFNLNLLLRFAAFGCKEVVMAFEQSNKLSYIYCV